MFSLLRAKTLRKYLGKNLINGLLKEMFGDTAEYKPLEKLNPGGVVVPFRYIGSEGENHVKGVYNGIHFELGDISLVDEEETIDGENSVSREKVIRFIGQWFICDLGKKPACDIYVSEVTQSDRVIMKSNVNPENEQFRNRFCVRADNPQEAYKILTPQMMEYITTMANKFGSLVYMSFLRDGRMHVAIKSDQKLFKLMKGKADVELLRQKFSGELCRFIDIIDTLHIKEMNV